jgi:hypothetical protein
MSKLDQHFKAILTVQAAGPVRPRTKYKEHKLLRAEATIQLPFAPYPGLYLHFTKPKKRGMPLSLYLRIRAAMWVLPDGCFECVADEVLGSSVFDELTEVRGSPRYEQSFAELQKTLSTFGFTVDTDVDATDWALNKRPDGTLIESK